MQFLKTPESKMLIPNEEETEQTRSASRKLAALKYNKQCDSISLSVSTTDQRQESIELPVTVYQLFLEVLSQVAKGNPVSLVPTNAELTTQEAADFINVSRPFLIKILEKNKIPFRKVGKHGRILLSDMINYKNKIEANREAVLEELAAQAQQLKLGY